MSDSVAPGAAGRPRWSRAEQTAWLGTVIALGSSAMVFAALFFACWALRLRQPGWPPPGLPPLPRTLPALATAILLAGAVVLQLALRAARRGRHVGAVAGHLTGIALGIAFLALQVILWQSLRASGLAFDDGALAAVTYGLTGIHALHLLGALVGLGLLVPAALAHEGGAGRAPSLRLWVLVWHFLTAVWLVLWLLVFVL